MEYITPCNALLTGELVLQCWASHDTSGVRRYGEAEELLEDEEDEDSSRKAPGDPDAADRHPPPGAGGGGVGEELRVREGNYTHRYYMA